MLLAPSEVSPPTNVQEEMVGSYLCTVLSDETAHVNVGPAAIEIESGKVDKLVTL